MIKCNYCEKEFEKEISRKAHERACAMNPDAEEYRKVLSQNGANTWRSFNKKRTLERKTFKLTCPKCGKTFEVTGTQNEFEKGILKKFCSRACANSRIITEEHKKKVSESLKKKERFCKDCGQVLLGNEKAFCETCKKAIKPQKEKKKIGRPISLKERPKIERKIACKHCNRIVIVNNNTKYCSKECMVKERTKLLSIAGKNSAEKQKETRRSKNEIEFCKMCENHFKKVLNNVPMFNGWDADVIIEDYKIAVLWNGAWHYKKITEKHSVEQVQNRDKIKISEIKKAGYTPYVIKDMGKYSKNKVNLEFNKLIDYITTKGSVRGNTLVS